MEALMHTRADIVPVRYSDIPPIHAISIYPSFSWYYSLITTKDLVFVLHIKEYVLLKYKHRNDI